MTRTEISIFTRQYVTGRVITGINYLIILLITSIESAVVRPWRGPSRVTPVSTAVPPSTRSNRRRTRVVAICDCPCTPLVRAHRLLVVGPAEGVVAGRSHAQMPTLRCFGFSYPEADWFADAPRLDTRATRLS